MGNTKIFWHEMELCFAGKHGFGELRAVCHQSTCLAIFYLQLGVRERGIENVVWKV